MLDRLWGSVARVAHLVTVVLELLISEAERNVHNVVGSVRFNWRYVIESCAATCMCRCTTVREELCGSSTKLFLAVLGRMRMVSEKSQNTKVLQNIKASNSKQKLHIVDILT